MKRTVFFCLMAIVVVCSLQAQDVIETTDGVRIEAKVTEISQTEIRYKEQSNLEGPVFILPVSGVKSITFSNGQVKLFNRPAAVNTPLTQNSATQVTIVKRSSDTGTTTIPSSKIEKIDDTYYLDGTRLSQVAYEAFLQKNCPEAYANMIRGQRLYNTGKGLLGTGIGLTAGGFGCMIGGIIHMATYNYDFYSYPYPSPAFTTGVLLCTFGEICGIASIPCLVVGGIKKNNAHEIYNTACRQNTMTLNLQLQSSKNGLGLALCF